MIQRFLWKVSMGDLVDTDSCGREGNSELVSDSSEMSSERVGRMIYLYVLAYQLSH